MDTKIALVEAIQKHTDAEVALKRARGNFVKHIRGVGVRLRNEYISNNKWLMVKLASVETSPTGLGMQIDTSLITPGDVSKLISTLTQTGWTVHSSYNVLATAYDAERTIIIVY